MLWLGAAVVDAADDDVDDIVDEGVYDIIRLLRAGPRAGDSGATPRARLGFELVGCKVELPLLGENRHLKRRGERGLEVFGVYGEYPCCFDEKNGDMDGWNGDCSASNRLRRGDRRTLSGAIWNGSSSPPKPLKGLGSTEVGNFL